MTGKIYWIQKDLQFEIGDIKNSSVQTAELKNIIIDDAFIEFEWMSNSDFSGGSIQLLHVHNSKYNGKSKDEDGKEAVLASIIYKNDHGFLIRGTWVEGVYFYTWFAEISIKQIK